MANSNKNVVAPKNLIAPTIPAAQQTLTAPTGSIAVSGARLVWFDGSVWKLVTTS